MKKIADAIIEIRFKTTSEGGRETSITGETYSCPLIIDNHAFDCRLDIGNNIIELGKTYDLPVKFLFKDLVDPYLTPGTLISLWEGKEVAEGKIKNIPR